ncbi:MULTISPECIES: hypothetical protein [Marinobacter]|uniref:hypothetical protein n=1 Tax=Marinobacter TaxID=2742 RepID=UPI000DAEA89C|nr:MULTISPECIES: hypothetical protein [Marinobacter]
MEGYTAEGPQPDSTECPHRDHTDSAPVLIGGFVTLSSLAILILVNLESVWPELTQSTGIELPYEHKLWLLPMCVTYALAGLFWTMSRWNPHPH